MFGDNFIPLLNLILKIHGEYAFGVAESHYLGHGAVVVLLSPKAEDLIGNTHPDPDPKSHG